MPPLVLAVRLAACGPVPLGAKVTGTWIFSPVPSSAGSGAEGDPSANWRASLEERLESVTGSVAVIVTVSSEELPMLVVGNSVAGALSTGVTGEPKASTCPSRVPT